MHQLDFREFNINGPAIPRVICMLVLCLLGKSAGREIIDQVHKGVSSSNGFLNTYQ